MFLRDHPANRRLRLQQVILADDLAEPGRAQPVGKRARGLGFEESCHCIYIASTLGLTNALFFGADLPYTNSMFAPFKNRNPWAAAFLAFLAGL